jgi:hypothetical protein
MLECKYIDRLLLVPVSKNLSKLHARTLVYRQVLVVVSKNPLKLHDVGLRKQLVVESPLPIMVSSNQINNLFHEDTKKLVKTPTQGFNLLQISPHWFLGNWTLYPCLKWTLVYLYLKLCPRCSQSNSLIAGPYPIRNLLPDLIP